MAFDKLAAAIQVRGLSPVERVVYATLCNHANGRTGFCSVSIARLCVVTGKSRRTVRRAISALKRRGYIRQRMRKQSTPVYVILPPPIQGGTLVSPITSKLKHEIEKKIQTMHSTTGKKLGAHPLAEIFPPMADADYKALLADVKANGLRIPITLLDGKILDGLNRYKACCELGIEAHCANFDGGDPLAFVLSVNLSRRHLTTSQRALVAARLANLNHGGDRRGTDQETNSSLENGSTIAAAATQLNVGTSAVKEAKHVLQEAPKKEIKAIERGEKTVHKVATELKQQAEEKQAEDAPAKLDHVGREIPEEIAQDWEHATAFAKSQGATIRKIRTEFKQMLDTRQRWTHHYDNGLIERFTNLLTGIETAGLPYTVCPTCKAFEPKRCKMCKGTGWLTKYVYTAAVPRETKAMWEKVK